MATICSQRLGFPDAGEIANLMSVDVQKVLDVLPCINTAWSSPLQIAIMLYFLWNTIYFAGVVAMVLLMGTNAWLAHSSRMIHVSQMKSKDEGLKLTSELISGMKVRLL